MKTAVGFTAVMVLLVMGCSTTQQVTVKDEPGICAFLGEVCHELQPGAQGEAGLRWVNPTSDPTRYHKVILEVVGFFGTDVSKVSPADQERLTALFQQALTDALATKYQVVDQPTPGTMQLQVVILDAEAATPGVRSVSMAIPQARLLGTGYYAASGKYPFVGGGQAAFKATDAGVAVGATCHIARIHPFTPSVRSRRGSQVGEDVLRQNTTFSGIPLATFAPRVRRKCRGSQVSRVMFSRPYRYDGEREKDGW